MADSGGKLGSWGNFSATCGQPRSSLGSLRVTLRGSWRAPFPQCSANFVFSAIIGLYREWNILSFAMPCLAILSAGRRSGIGAAFSLREAVALEMLGSSGIARGLMVISLDDALPAAALATRASYCRLASTVGGPQVRRPLPPSPHGGTTFHGTVVASAAVVAATPRGLAVLTIGMM